MWLLPAFSLLGNAAARIYYRLTVAGEPIPRHGPVLLVANHPNSLFDPVLVVAAAGRPVRFLAKVPLFSDAKIGWIIRAVGAIPVYRRVDEPAAMGQNVDMFRAVCGELSKKEGRGAAIGIFPEGLSHSEPSLASLKTGASRIALGAYGKRPRVFPIIPIGIVLRQKGAFRSEALLVLGEPISWDDLAPRGVEDHDAVRELTGRVEAGLRQVTVNLDQWEDRPLVECAEEIWATERGSDGDPASRLARLEAATSILGQLRREPNGPEASLIREVRNHHRRLKLLHFRPSDLSADVRLQAGVRWATGRLYLIGLPVVLTAVAGHICFWPPYRLTGLIADSLRPTHDRRATYRLLTGMMLYSLWVILLSGIVALWKNLAAGLLGLLVIPLLGIFGRRIRERWKAAWDDMRRFVLLRSPTAFIRDLKEQQRVLADRLEAVYRRRR
jgi:1-acyl-sn-glycerol-3-phosphate acyltransferase